MIWKNIAFPINEVWKPITFATGFYEVSNYGRVKSVDRVITYVRGGKEICRTFYGKILSPKTDKDGYKEVCLTVEGSKYHRRVHRLVGMMFLGGHEEDSVIDHIIPEKDYNMFYNLQWCTNTFNTIKHYAEEAGLKRSLSSLSKYEWYYIGYLYESGIEYEAISYNLGLGIKSVDTLWEGLSGRRLSSISGFKSGDFIKRKHPKTKLTVDTVINIIKDRLDKKLPLKELSFKYEVSESMISRFCKGTRQPEALIKYQEHKKREEKH